MARNRGEFVTEVEAILKRTDSTTRVQEWLNDAMITLARLFDWSELRVTNTTAIDTVVDQLEYDFATLLTSDSALAFKSIIDLRYLDGSRSRKLIFIQPQRLDLLVPSPADATTASPVWYTLVGATASLYPIPDEVNDVTIRYNAWPATLSANANSPELTRADDAIVAYTVWHALQGLGLYEDAAQQLERAQRALAQAIKADTEKPDWVPIMRPFFAAPIGTRHIGDPFAQRGHAGEIP